MRKLDWLIDETWAHMRGDECSSWRDADEALVHVDHGHHFLDMHGGIYHSGRGGLPRESLGSGREMRKVRRSGTAAQSHGERTTDSTSARSTARGPWGLAASAREQCDAQSASCALGARDAAQKRGIGPRSLWYNGYAIAPRASHCCARPRFCPRPMPRRSSQQNAGYPATALLARSPCRLSESTPLVPLPFPHSPHFHAARAPPFTVLVWLARRYPKPCDCQAETFLTNDNLPYGRSPSTRGKSITPCGPWRMITLRNTPAHNWR